MNERKFLETLIERYVNKMATDHELNVFLDLLKQGGFGINLCYKKLPLNLLFETFKRGHFYKGTRCALINFDTDSRRG